VIGSAPRFPPRVRILYEDSRAATRGFGLHDFVLANVQDVLRDSRQDIERYRLQKLIEAIPKRSDTKVLSALEHDAERLHGGSTVLLPWLDDDKLHRALKLPAGQPAEALIAAIQQRLPPSLRPEAVRIHLLRGNVEQLLRRLDAVKPTPFDQATLSEALDKVPTSGDLCFQKAAAMEHEAWRGRAREGDPGLDETIRYLAELAARETWPPW
jgi:hypothetical protein